MRGDDRRMGGDATAASGSDMRARADGARDVIDAHRRAGFGARRSSSVQITRQRVAMIAKNHQTIHAIAKHG